MQIINFKRKIICYRKGMSQNGLTDWCKILSGMAKVINITMKKNDNEKK